MKKIFSVIFGLVLFAFLAQPVVASEGFVKLENSESRTRCFAQSILLEENKYSLTVTCRDLIYPPSEDTINYALWANPVGDRQPVFMGNLSLGRITAEAKSPFESLFVTTELASKPKTPSDRTVLFGEVRSIEFIGDLEKEIEALETKFEKQQKMEEELILPTEAVEEAQKEATDEAEGKLDLKEVISKYAFLPVLLIIGLFVLILFLVRSK